MHNTTLPSHQAGRKAGVTNAFRTTAAILAGAAVLLFCLGYHQTDVASAWTAALAAAGATFVLAEVILAAVMVVLPPVLIIALLVRFLAG